MAHVIIASAPTIPRQLHRLSPKVGVGILLDRPAVVEHKLPAERWQVDRDAHEEDGHDSGGGGGGGGVRGHYPTIMLLHGELLWTRGKETSHPVDHTNRGLIEPDLQM